MNLMEKYYKKMQAQVTSTLESEGNCNDMVTPPQTKVSTQPEPDTDLLNIPVTSWLEKLSDSERDTYNERAAIMEYDGGLPREQAEVEAIKRIIRERVISGKCDKCERVNGCIMTRGQRALCEISHD